MRIVVKWKYVASDGSVEEAETGYEIEQIDEGLLKFSRDNDDYSVCYADIEEFAMNEFPERDVFNGSYVELVAVDETGDLFYFRRNG